MKAMILAAGRGKRMGKLSQDTPKPLLKIGRYSLIEWQILHLRDNGFCDLVINLGYLGEQIAAHLSDGRRYGVDIRYSQEPQTGLETGGGVLQALPLLGEQPFLLTNADVFCNYPYRRLVDKQPPSIHLVLVDNPDFKKAGDFSLRGKHLQLGESLTFAGISVINPLIFSTCQAGVFPIAPLFRQAIAEKTATAEHYRGVWHDVGTPERLATARRFNSEITPTADKNETTLSDRGMILPDLNLP